MHIYLNLTKFRSFQFQMKGGTLLPIIETILFLFISLGNCTNGPDWEIQKSRLVYHFTASDARNAPFSRQGKSIFPIRLPPMNNKLNEPKMMMDLKPQSSRIVANYSPGPPLVNNKKNYQPRDTLQALAQTMGNQQRQYLPPPRSVKNPIQPTSFSAALDIPQIKPSTYSTINPSGSQNMMINVQPNLAMYMRGQVLPAQVNSPAGSQNQAQLSSRPLPHFQYRYHYHTPGMGENPPQPQKPMTETTNRPPKLPVIPEQPPIPIPRPNDPNLDQSPDTNSGVYGPGPTQKPNVESTTITTTVAPPVTTSTVGEESKKEEREIRFLIYKPGDEEIIKHAVVEDAKLQHEKVSFLEGPTLVLQNQEKIHLPKKKKTVLYIMLKEPEINTNVDVVEPEGEKEDDLEVFVIYQNKNKGVKQKHYKLDASGSATSGTSSAPHHGGYVNSYLDNDSYTQHHNHRSSNTPEVGYSSNLRGLRGAGRKNSFNLVQELETSASSVAGNVVQFSRKLPSCVTSSELRNEKAKKNE